MAYVLEISRRDISRNAEECAYRNEDGHNAAGTGPGCDAHCTDLEGNVRGLRDYGTDVIEMDGGDREEYGGPVAWAAHYLSKHHPDVTYGPSGDQVAEREWLSGTSPDPYKDEETETTVYMKGEFTDAQRGQIAKLAALDYSRMMSTLAAWGL